MPDPKRFAKIPLETSTRLQHHLLVKLFKKPSQLVSTGDIKGTTSSACLAAKSACLAASVAFSFAFAISLNPRQHTGHENTR